MTKHKILVVEDSPIVREPVVAVLRQAGYEACCAKDGQEALETLLAVPPALVLLDLGLPKVDGLTVLRTMRLQAKLKDVPIIVLSAVAERERVTAAVKLGISGYLLKSQFSVGQLLDKVGEIVTGKKAAVAPAGTKSSGSARDAEGGPPSAGDGGEEAPADPAEALRALKPLLTKPKLMERLDEYGELRAMSPAVSHVLKLTSNARCSIETVAKAVGQDYAIALKMLKLANSSVYTRGEPVDSVQKAVVRIGMERIRQTVLNLSVIESFGQETFGDMISLPQFWEHAIACGIIGAEIAHHTGATSADGAFTMGLLHDLGRLVLCQQIPDEYKTVLETAAKLQLPLEDVETKMLLLNHADVMERMLHLWNFPKELIAPVVNHHLAAANARSIASSQVLEMQRLGLANRIAHAMLLGTSGNEAIYPTQEMCEAVGLSPESFDAIVGSAREQTDDIKFALLAGANENGWPQRRHEIQERLGKSFVPLFAGVAAMDGVRVFIDQLRPDGGLDAPTVAVAHIQSPKERAEVSDRLIAAEDGEGVRGMPVIVVSPGGKLHLNESVEQDRRVIPLAVPFTLDRFVNAVRSAEIAGEALP